MDGKISKVMPHSTEAEEALLGCVISDSEMTSEFVPDLSEGDFYSDANRIVFSAISKIFNNNKLVDLVTLSDELERSGNMEKIGGIDYVAHLTTTVASTANAKHYFDIVKNDSLRRKLIRSSQEIIDRSYTADDDEALAFAEKEIFDISSGNERRFPTEISESFNEVIERFSKVSKDANAFKGLTTGFKQLDYMLNGLQKSDLILIAARPAEGKTSLAMNIVESAALKGGATCLCFSLEMSRSQLAQRMLCSNAHVSMSKANKGQISMTEWQQLWASKEALDNAKILIDDTAGITPADMLSKCRRIKNKYGSLDLIMVDYIQLMSSGAKSKADNRQQEVSEISRNLKLIAREMDCPLIALSQLSRDIEKRQPPIPQLSDLRESGAIEQDADIVMFIYNPKNANKAGGENFNGSGNSGLKEIIIAKHRNGPTGTVPVRWIGEYTRYEDAGNTTLRPESYESAPQEEYIQEDEVYTNESIANSEAEFYSDIPLEDLIPPEEEE